MKTFVSQKIRLTTNLLAAAARTHQHAHRPTTRCPNLRGEVADRLPLLQPHVGLCSRTHTTPTCRHILQVSPPAQAPSFPFADPGQPDLRGEIVAVCHARFQTAFCD